MHGFLIIDKPAGITSFDVVYKVRKLLGKVKVGHTGTLDPLATGVLVLAVGQATKFIEYLVGSDKTYECKAVFGATSSTYDGDGEIVQAVEDDFALTDSQIQDVINQNFLGKIKQVPPAYSAKWVNGKRAHQLVRKGKDPHLKAQEIEVHSFKLKKLQYPEADFICNVGSGTYVRSLIHDLGQKLGCGGYVKELRRTNVADFEIENAITIDELRDQDDPQKNIISLGVVMQHIFPRLDVSEDQLVNLRHGKEVMLEDTLSEGMYSVFEGSDFAGVAAKLSANSIKFRKQLTKKAPVFCG